MSTSKELREFAWAKQKEDWVNPMLVTLIYIVICGGIGSIPFVGWAGSILLGWPLGYAIVIYFLQKSRGEQISVSCLFEVFQIRYKRSLLVMFWTFIFTFLWALLLIIPGMIKSYAYAMAPYIAEENLDIPERDTLKMSEQLMEGHKMELFLLDISFFGWYLLAIITFGIGMLFVLPYHYTARARFYDELTGKAIAESTQNNMVAEGEVAETPAE